MTLVFDILPEHYTLKQEKCGVAKCRDFIPLKECLAFLFKLEPGFFNGAKKCAVSAKNYFDDFFVYLGEIAPLAQTNILISSADYLDLKNSLLYLKIIRIYDIVSMNLTSEKCFHKDHLFPYNKKQTFADEVVFDEKKRKRRNKERRIGFIIEKVKEWRSLYQGQDNGEGGVQKKSLDEAADAVGISKKSLDDYMMQLKYGKAFGFNFNEHCDDKVGVLRNFVKKQRNLKKLTYDEKYKYNESQAVDKKFKTVKLRPTQSSSNKIYLKKEITKTNS